MSYTDNDHLFFHECWQCNGEGTIASCVEEFACIDPESGCDFCSKTCDICQGKGGWHDEEPDDGQ